MTLKNTELLFPLEMVLLEFSDLAKSKPEKWWNSPLELEECHLILNPIMSVSSFLVTID